jgi:DnaK suppressor protein
MKLLSQTGVYLWQMENGERTMSKNELEKYRTALEAKKAEIAASLRNRDEIAIEKTADAIDEVQLAGERELAIRNLDRESNLLRNVRAALARIADGSFGICMHCEEEINTKRLNAVPWAPFCIRCQEAADRHEFEAGESIEQLLADAA